MAATVDLNTKKDQELLARAQKTAWERIRLDKRLKAPQSLQRISLHELAMELLTKDWLAGTEHDLPTKLYLAEKVLPVLVLSLEQLLVNVSQKGLEEQEGFRDDFNPVNFVAEFLMRHNPAYPCPPLPPSSLYYGSLKEIAIELKNKLIGKEENTIERVKKQLHEKRESEKAEIQAKIEEEERKRSVLTDVGHIWKIDGQIIQAKQIYQVVSMWLQTDSGCEFKDHFKEFLDLDITGETNWNEEELLQIVHPLTLTLPEVSFVSLTDYLKECGKERQRALSRSNRKEMFKDVFMHCKSVNLNTINRQHIMSLFAIFYDKANEKTKEKLTNPRTWPGSGQEEDEPTDEEWKKEGSAVSDEAYQDFMTSLQHKSGNVMEETSSIDGSTRLPSAKSESFATHTTESQSIWEFSSLNEHIANKQLSAPVKTVLPEGPGVQWNPEHVDLQQFVQLSDLFLGNDSSKEVSEDLAGFIMKNYMSEESEQLESDLSVNSATMKLQKSLKIDEIFTLWDKNCSGYLNADEIITLLGQWRNFGTEDGKQIIEIGFERFGVVGRNVSRLQFTALAEVLTSEMTMNEFKEFVDVIVNSLKLSQEQEKRRTFRQELLQKIKRAGYSTTGELLPSLEAAINAIEKDSNMFGDSKNICISIGLLEKVNDGDSLCLNYKAASKSIAHRIVGKKLTPSQAPVSFSAIKAGKPVHVPNVHKHGSVYFFIPEHNQENEYQGSLVVALIESNGLVVGTISIDSILSINIPEVYFSDHEIAFYQGVGVTLGEVYQASIARGKLLAAVEIGITWLLQQCLAIHHIDMYLVRLISEDSEGKEFVLQMAMHSEDDKVVNCNEILKKNDNSFKDYLFQCVETSETITAEAYCYHHLCCPLHDTSGHAIAIIDFTLKEKINLLHLQHIRDINKMIKLSMAAFHQTSINHIEDHQVPVKVYFHQLLLEDLQSCMARVDKRAFAELLSYNEPPQHIMNIINALLTIIYPEIDCDSWQKCKPWINIDLLKAVESYKPKMDVVHPKLELILETLKNISPKEVFQHGSLPTKYIYTWVSSCAAVLEHSSSC